MALYVTIHGAAAKIASELGVSNIHVSLSHSTEIAAAVVILE